MCDRERERGRVRVRERERGRAIWIERGRAIWMVAVARELFCMKGFRHSELKVAETQSHTPSHTHTRRSSIRISRRHSICPCTC